MPRWFVFFAASWLLLISVTGRINEAAAQAIGPEILQEIIPKTTHATPVQQAVPTVISELEAPLKNNSASVIVPALDVEITGALAHPMSLPALEVAIAAMQDVDSNGDEASDITASRFIIPLLDPAPVDVTLHTVAWVSAVEGSVPSPAQESTLVSLSTPAPSASGPLSVLPLPDPAPVVLTINPSQTPVMSGFAAQIFARITTPDWSRHPRFKDAQRDEIITFYKQRGFEALWVVDGQLTANARDVLTVLAKASEQGLQATDYTPPLLDLVSLKSRDKAAHDQALADMELRLSMLVVMYARDARGARLEPAKLSSLMTPKLELPKGDKVLASLAEGGKSAEVLEAYQPRHEQYQRLKTKLAQLRASRPTIPLVRLPQGPTVRLGMRDARVPLIRDRFNIGPAHSDAPESAAIYDEKVASAVAGFQKEQGIPASGRLDRQTVEALAGDNATRQEADIIANMERWRWLPADMGKRYIAVNLPEFRLRLMDEGRLVHQTRVIVGKPETPSPVFSDEMEHVIINPSWAVPPSILRKEFLPKLALDPGYAEKRGFQVVRNGAGVPVSVRQPPGERNALGLIKFIFPNQHSVYLHDTPSRNLFASERRAFSHGCIRVDQPFELGEAVLKVQGEWTSSRLKSLVGRGERMIKLEKHLPVHISYFTITIDENGEMHRFDDLYGFNRRIREALERVSTL